MPWPYPFGETVQILDGTPTGTDTYNDPQRTWPVKHTYGSCAVWASDGNGTGGNEFTDGRDTVIRGLTVALPPGVAVNATDRVRARGEDWEIVGQPTEDHSPFSNWSPGMPVVCRKVEG